MSHVIRHMLACYEPDVSRYMSHIISHRLLVTFHTSDVRQHTSFTKGTHFRFLGMPHPKYSLRLAE